MAVVKDCWAVDDVQSHSQQQHVDSECNPAPQRRGRTREAGEESPQYLRLPLLILNRLLHIELLQRPIFGAFDELGFGARVAFDCIFDNDVQLI